MSKHAPLGCHIDKQGRLVVVIGVDVLAFATLHSAYAWLIANPNGQGNLKPEDVYRINPTRFARDVRRALIEEDEDGTTILSTALDLACQKAIEDGSEHFIEEK